MILNGLIFSFIYIYKERECYYKLYNLNGVWNEMSNATCGHASCPINITWLTSWNGHAD